MAPADRDGRDGAVPPVSSGWRSPSRTPAETAGRWRVNYLLQALDDLSLLVPVKAAWQERALAAPILGRDGFQPREYLLAALGQAATLCPRIEASLKSAAPAGYLTSTPPARTTSSSERAAAARAGGLRRLPARLVDPQGNQAAARGPGGRRRAEAEEQGRRCRSTRSSSSTGRSPSATRR